LDLPNLTPRFLRLSLVVSIATMKNLKPSNTTIIHYILYYYNVPPMIPFFVLMVGLKFSKVPWSYADGSAAPDRASHAG
jgi:hypothetical protein